MDQRRRSPERIAADRQEILTHVGLRTVKQEPWMRTIDVKALVSEGKLETTIRREGMIPRGWRGGVLNRNCTYLRRTRRPR